MQAMRRTANEVKPEFWLMGEVIHGDYSRWVNEGTLHSVTNYQLHKALYSGHNDHNYFEIAHTVKRLYDMGGNRVDSLKLYNFVDNHDVERIYTKLSNKNHFTPVHILLYTLPGIPSVYYGSEFGIEGRKERFSDDSLRPALSLEQYTDALHKNPCTKLIAALGSLRQQTPALSYGEYKELLLTNCQYAFARTWQGQSVLIAVNNADNSYTFSLPAGNFSAYVGGLSGTHVSAQNGTITITIPANSGDIWIPESLCEKITFKTNISEIKADQPMCDTTQVEHSGQTINTTPIESMAAAPLPDKPYEEMTIEELQAAILDRLAKNGPVTDQMRRDVAENVYHNSLLNWIRSFR